MIVLFVKSEDWTLLHPPLHCYYVCLIHLKIYVSIYFHRALEVSQLGQHNKITRRLQTLPRFRDRKTLMFHSNFEYAESIIICISGFYSN